MRIAWRIRKAVRKKRKMTKALPCEFCESAEGLEDRLVTVYRSRGGQHFIFERVPATVCRACGHRYFGGGVVEEMDRLMDVPEAQAHVRPVPVIAFTAKK